MEKKISVIVPIYKVAEYLKKCVECLTNQTYSNLEILLVDDGSPDSCPQICDELANSDDRIKVIHKQNGGVSSARNAGLKAATGDYISFLDPDDIIPIKYYEVLISNIDDCDCSLCKYKEFSDDYEINIPAEYNVSFLTKEEAIFNGLSRQPEIFYVVWNKLIKADVVQELTFDENMKNGEDSVFAFQIINKCNKVAIIDLPMYGYYIREDGAVKQMDSIGMMNIIKMSSYINSVCIGMDKQIKKRSLDVYSYTLVSMYQKLKAVGRKEEIQFAKKMVNKNIFTILKSKKFSVKEKISLILSR